MRTISTALAAAQEASSSEPFIHLFFNSADGETTVDYSSRLLQLEHHEEPYNEWASIILYNNDRGVQNVKGYWLEIGYGQNCEPFGGNEQEYKDTPRLWVKSQTIVSRAGILFTELLCTGMWVAMQELDLVTKGEPPHFDNERYGPGYTVYDTLKDLFAATTFPVAGVDTPFELEPLGDQDDGIMDSFTPELWLNQSPFENRASIAYRLIGMTKSYVRTKPGLKLEVRYPQDDDEVDEIYHSNRDFVFFEYREKQNINTPNDVVVYANPGEDGMWEDIITSTGHEDEDSIDAYHRVTAHHIAADIVTQTDADNRGEAILSKIKAEILAGRLVIPHDCRVELYDRMEINDSR